MIENFNSLSQSIELIFSFNISKINDEKLLNEVAKETKLCESLINDIFNKLYLQKDNDTKNVIFEIHTGMGGEDAEDFSNILLNMYLKYFDFKKWDVEILNKNESSAGIKSITIQIKGEFVYGYLQYEKGIHRLIRLSPFKSNSSRQTSFSAIEVIPLLENTDNIKINEKDIQLDVFKSSGHGGQSVNTTDSAVRIRHIPTGIVVVCQNERSQLQNKKQGMNVLLSKLWDLKEKEHKEKISDLKGDILKIDFGNQKRTYVFHPQKYIKNHITGSKFLNIEEILSGNLDEIIKDEMKFTLLKKL